MSGSNSNVLGPVPTGDDLDTRAAQAAVRTGLFGAGQPATFGRYQITGRLGTGGLGIVYSAVDPSSGSEVAVKVLRRELSRAAKAKHRLWREARTMVSIDHANVLSVFDVGWIDGQLYIASELAHGGTLAQLVSEPARLGTVLSRFTEAGRGLLTLHEAGIVHRDFKPANVLIADDGRAMVGDLGLVLFSDNDLEPDAIGGGDLRLTADGARVGTPAYMAPEQRDCVGVSAATDQYAFCLSLYEVLFGELPKSPLRIPLETQRREPVPLALQRLLRRGLERDPRRRFRSMAGLLVRLEACASRRLRWLWPTVVMSFAAAACACAWVSS